MARTEVEKKLIHIVMEMAYHEGIEEGRKQAMEAMKQTMHSHTPKQNVYASLAFDRLPYFVEETPMVCGNCTHFKHDEFSDEGFCLHTNKPMVSSMLCDVVREDDD